MTKRLNIPQTIEDIYDCLDLSEIIAHGIEVYCRRDDDATKYRTVHAAAELLKRHGLGEDAAILRNGLSRAKCLEAGVCHHCGDDVTEQTTTDHHPYGATTAAERHVAYVCRHCGEV